MVMRRCRRAETSPAAGPRRREVNLRRFFWRELTLAGARLYDHGDFERAVALVADGTIPAGATA